MTLNTRATVNLSRGISAEHSAQIEHGTHDDPGWTESNISGYSSISLFEMAGTATAHLPLPTLPTQERFERGETGVDYGVGEASNLVYNETGGHNRASDNGKTVNKYPWPNQNMILPRVGAFLCAKG